MSLLEGGIRSADLDVGVERGVLDALGHAHEAQVQHALRDDRGALLPGAHQLHARRGHLRLAFTRV